MLIVSEICLAATEKEVCDNVIVWEHDVQPLGTHIPWLQNHLVEMIDHVRKLKTERTALLTDLSCELQQRVGQLEVLLDRANMERDALKERVKELEEDVAMYKSECRRSCSG